MGRYPVPITIRDPYTGVPASGITATIQIRGANNPAFIYESATGVEQLPGFKVRSDRFGKVPGWLDPGQYVASLTGDPHDITKYNFPVQYFSIAGDQDVTGLQAAVDQEVTARTDADTVLTAAVDAAQTLAEAVQSSQGQPNGIASLDATANVPLSQLGNVPTGGSGGPVDGGTPSSPGSGGIDGGTP